MTDGLLGLFPGAGAILSVGLLRSIEWAKMERRFDVDGGVSGGLQYNQQMIFISLVR